MAASPSKQQLSSYGTLVWTCGHKMWEGTRDGIVLGEDWLPESGSWVPSVVPCPSCEQGTAYPVELLLHYKVFWEMALGTLGVKGVSQTYLPWTSLPHQTTQDRKDFS